MSINNSGKYEIPEAILRILESRGIGEENLDEFFSYSPRLAHDPFLLTNMREGVDLLLSAIDSNKRIIIYGDYDVDGITATSLMMKVIGSLTDNVAYYIPSRLDEGYGLHKEAIDRIYEDGGELIVTVDCGSVSRYETAYAHSLGIDTLVTDHHSMSDIRAEGIIINPRLPEDEYPFKELAGVGVAYKVALALAREREIPKKVMSELPELVAIGTIADIMSLMDENRTIVKCGLRFIHLGCKSKGLKRLIELSGLDCKTLRTSDISFGIAPKINASGRLGDAAIGVKLFISDDEAEIEKCCSMLNEANRKRRLLQDEAYERGLAIVEDEIENGDFVVLEINDSHEGVLGIVAGKIREAINRPVVVVSKNGDVYKGTGRSIGSIDLFSMLDKYRDEFISFGGHAAACGFTIAEERMVKLRTALNEDISKMLEDNSHLLDVEYNYDLEIDGGDINLSLAQAVKMLEPCGKNNEVPIFLIKGVQMHNWRYLKNDTQYAKFQISTKNGNRIDCLIFRDAEKYHELLERNEKVDIMAKIDINNWKNASRVQLVIEWVLPTGEL